MGKIIVGVDASAGAASALQWAVEEGSARGWPVEAALAWGLLNQHHIEANAPFDRDYSATTARQALAAYVRAAIGDRQVDRRVTNDLPARGLLDLVEAEDASLLVVGGRGVGELRAALLGSVSYECVHRSPTPVAVVRAGMVHHKSDSPARVVVGIDGSPAAQAALEWAVQEAAVRGATLEVVHAWRTPYVGGDPFGATIVIDPKAFEDGARAVMAKAMASVDVSSLDQPVVTSIAHDGAAAAILTAGEQADLVVMGARGVGGFAGLLLGSASSQVVHHARCPVVIVPSPA
jgi:nucleotide-binding universal stress UspA family protein